MNNTLVPFGNRSDADHLFNRRSVLFGKLGIRCSALREGIFADSFGHGSDIQIDIPEAVRIQTAEHGIGINRRFFIGGLYSLHIGQHRTRIIRKFICFVIFIRCIRNRLECGRKRNILNIQAFERANRHSLNTLCNGERTVDNLCLICADKRFTGYAVNRAVSEKFAFLVTVLASFRKFEVGRNGNDRLNACGNGYGKRKRAHASVVPDQSFHIIAPQRIDQNFQSVGKFEGLQIFHIPKGFFKHLQGCGELYIFKLGAGLELIDVLNSVSKIRIDRRIALIGGCRVHSCRNGEIHCNHIAAFYAVNRYVFGQERDCRKSLDILPFFRIARLIIEADDRIIVSCALNLLICQIGRFPHNPDCRIFRNDKRREINNVSVLVHIRQIFFIHVIGDKIGIFLIGGFHSRIDSDLNTL